MRVMGIVRWGVLLGWVGCAAMAWAQASNLEPKYGAQPKNEAQRAADQAFLAQVDGTPPGDRRKAADHAAQRGWEAWRKGDRDTAMRRFNQAWLLQNDHGGALWGMAIIEMSRQRIDSGLRLFEEAALSLSPDVDFLVDFAITLDRFGLERQLGQYLQRADALYELVWQMAPEHTMNLQNWAFSRFNRADYAGAWEKLLLAQKTARAKELDPSFEEELRSKMPKPLR